ncbi:MAG: hypothetical protein WCI73_14490 [Phycisphaerae bacterium]
MAKAFTSLAATAVILIAAAALSCTSNRKPEIFGKWTITGFKFGGISALGEPEARQMVGKVAVITAHEITFDGTTSPLTRLETHRADAADYFADGYRTTPETVGIMAKDVRIVTTDCSLAPFSEFIQLSDARLMVSIEGVFFILARKGAP